EHGVDQASQMAAEFQRSLAHGSVTHQLALATTSPDASYQTDLMREIRDAIREGQTIVMDSGELVGATYAGYDAAAGTAISYKSRWGR
ncbi:MAG: hypothetical protein FWG67_03870, partial [Defluviitaleaceae bacterium]|nr:hypothetical protein [Defluviitaleaceae bacterium]